MKQCSCGAYLTNCPNAAKRCNACRAYLKEQKGQHKAVHPKEAIETRRFALARALRKHGLGV